MTIKINLLAWRQVKRNKDRKKIVQLALAEFIVIILLCILVDCLSFNFVVRQQTINQRLKSEIGKLNLELKEIKQLKIKKELMIKKLIFLEKLQNSRIVLVHLFDELLKLIPEGIYLNLVKGTKEKITMEGNAKSNSALSQLMQNIEKNPWMHSSNLIEIKKEKPFVATNLFRLDFKLKAKNLEGLSQ